MNRAAWVLLAAAALHAQHGSTTRSNPFNTPEDRVEGARLFRAHCSACHGPGGAGGAAGPDLTSGTFRRGSTDDALFGVVAKGIPGTTMPAYAGDGRQAWQLVAYVNSLSAGKASEKARGDAARGEKLFASHGCGRCHAVGAEGPVFGPPLGAIGAVRSYGALLRSVTDPDEEVAADYRMLRGRTKKGENVAGIRLNEDSYSIQYRDGSALKSIGKSDLESYSIDSSSPMPSFRGKLSADETEDLIAYLSSLRGAR